ncbi:MAG: hypothetical protein QM289_04670 [Bacillota bacterium]|jgi:hypothetical protein|nr:hypothetical protein [Bacillota bacterium]
MAALYTINKIYKKHHQEYPDSVLSERAIRLAIKRGELPSIKTGNRALVCGEVFEQWIKGELKDDS